MAAMSGCLIISRSRAAFPGLRWMIPADLSALIGVLLMLLRGMVPDFFSVMVANEFLLGSFVLIGEAIMSILGRERRYRIWGIGLLLAMPLPLLFLSEISNDFSLRVLVRAVFFLLESFALTIYLFRHQNPILRSPVRVASWAFMLFSLAQSARIIVACFLPSGDDIFHMDTAQAAFSIVISIVSLCCFISVLWLAFWSQRLDLQKMAYTDVLTGVMNRRAFDQTIDFELKRSSRRKESLSLLLLDIDSFKPVNDIYGHLVGDEVLRQIGSCLNENVRPGDTVSRYGGEEFAILLRDVTLHQAELMAERLRGLVEDIHGLPHGIRITVSIGIATLEQGDSVESFLKRSDDALYLAKRSGRNRVSAMMA